MIEVFQENFIYSHKQMPEGTTLFLCESSVGNSVGKLVQYVTKDNPKGPAVWTRTNRQYFLNNYIENDIKSLFVDCNNYDLVGALGNNFDFINDDENLLVKINKGTEEA